MMALGDLEYVGECHVGVERLAACPDDGSLREVR